MLQQLLEFSTISKFKKEYMYMRKYGTKKIKKEPLKFRCFEKDTKI